MNTKMTIVEALVLVETSWRTDQQGASRDEAHEVLEAEAVLIHARLNSDTEPEVTVVDHLQGMIKEAAKRINGLEQELEQSERIRKGSEQARIDSLKRIQELEKGDRVLNEIIETKRLGIEELGKQLKEKAHNTQARMIQRLEASITQYCVQIETLENKIEAAIDAL